MRTRNPLTLLTAAALAAVMLIPVGASAGGRGGYERCDRNDGYGYSHHRHQHKHRNHGEARTVRQYYYDEPRLWRGVSPLVYREAPRVRVGRDGGIDIRYGGWD